MVACESYGPSNFQLYILNYDLPRYNDNEMEFYI